MSGGREREGSEQRKKEKRESREREGKEKGGSGGRGEREQVEEEKGKGNEVSKRREGRGGREGSREGSEEFELKEKGLYESTKSIKVPKCSCDSEKEALYPSIQPTEGLNSLELFCCQCFSDQVTDMILEGAQVVLDNICLDCPWIGSFRQNSGVAMDRYLFCCSLCHHLHVAYRNPRSTTHMSYCTRGYWMMSSCAGTAVARNLQTSWPG